MGWAGAGKVRGGGGVGFLEESGPWALADGYYGFRRRAIMSFADNCYGLADGYYGLYFGFRGRLIILSTVITWGCTTTGIDGMWAV